MQYLHRFVAAMVLALVLAAGCGEDSGGPSGPGNGNGEAFTDSVMVYDMDMIRRTYFVLRMSADPHRLMYPNGALDLPTRVTLWVDDHDETNNQSQDAVPGYAYLSRADEDSLLESTYVAGHFTSFISPDDYEMEPGSGLVTLATPIPLEYTLAASYVDSGRTRVGNASAVEPVPDTLRLKMIKPGSDIARTEPWTYTLGYEIRSIYDLERQGFAAEDFQLEIRRMRSGADSVEVTGQGDRTFLDILGLDRRGNFTGFPAPDGRVDHEWIDLATGLLLFPDLRPFAPDSLSYPLQVQNPGIYDTHEATIRMVPQLYRKYYMIARFR